MSSSGLMHRSALATVTLLLALSSPARGTADEIKFMRDPHIGHGMITFSYHGDIWIANRDGSSARRLTTHVAREITPRFSPDGQWVAFTSDRFGNNDVFIRAHGREKAGALQADHLQGQQRDRRP